MSATRTLRLGRVIDGARARITVQLGSDGAVADAWFDLDGLPRVERLLRGRPVAEVPVVIERLCGICPATHHLAGARALDALAGREPATPTAQAVRRLLHHGAVLQTHARSLAEIDPARSRDLHGFAHHVVAAAAGGSPVPRCAVPGGVASAVAVTDRAHLTHRIDAAIAWATELLAQAEAQTVPMWTHLFAGHDVALVDENGALDLYGQYLSAVTATGAVAVAGARASQWPALVAEARPGLSASRPYLRADGAGYRVGPVAQLRAATHLPTPLAESARQRWHAADGGTVQARAVVAVHAVEAIQELLRRPELTAGPLVGAPTPSTPSEEGATAVGWVDGPRGLLVHTYRVDSTGTLTQATITTPTAQNEPWLADLLTAAARHQPVTADLLIGRPPPTLAQAFETAVRTADPCLPCTMLPTGSMALTLTVLDARGHAAATWNFDQDTEES